MTKWVRISTEITREQLDNLNELAAQVGSVAERGPTTGEPSWRTLLRQISEGEINVSKSYFFSNENGMDDEIVWSGEGWYAPRQEWGRIRYFIVGTDPEDCPDTYHLGLGTPGWMTVKDLEGAE